jgi:hypothetical protein
MIGIFKHSIPFDHPLILPIFQARKQVWDGEANHPRTATNHCPDLDSTPASASHRQSPCLDSFYCSSIRRINKLDITQENKGIMRLHQDGVIKKIKHRSQPTNMIAFQ